VFDAIAACYQMSIPHPQIRHAGMKEQQFGPYDEPATAAWPDVGVHYLSDRLLIGIDPKMQLAPSPPQADAVFLIEPFALAIILQTPVLSTSRCSGSVRSVRFGKIVKPALRRLSVV
jgi:hypothetical protein